MLSNLMASDKKTNEFIEKNPEKKKKANKIKTDPNLFLFSDVVDEGSEIKKEISSVSDDTEISDISEFSDANEPNEDMDTPSYLRKGSNQ